MNMFKTSEDAVNAMMKYVEHFKDDHFGWVSFNFFREQNQGDISWTVALTDEDTSPLRGGRAGPEGNDGVRCVKQALRADRDICFDDSRYADFEYSRSTLDVLYYYVVDIDDNKKYLVSPPSLDEPYDDENGTRRDGGPNPRVQAERRFLNDYEDPHDITTATGLMSEGESRQEGWVEYGPDADQYD